MWASDEGTAFDSTKTTSTMTASVKTTSGGSSGAPGAPGSATGTTGRPATGMAGSTAAGASTAASSSGSVKTCQKGVGYNSASYTLEPDIFWAYSWASSQGGTLSSGVMYIPQLPWGVPWLKEFVAACSDCTIDAVALHWYDSAGNNAYFQSYLEDAYANLSKPIWLTEYLGTGTPTDQATFMVTTVDWLEKQDYIEKYAACGDFCDSPVANFVLCDGSQNDLGKAYSDTS
ncbi:hypothetical protein JCM21900_004518 [Sporobolomyces salmonicolor]